MAKAGGTARRALETMSDSRAGRAFLGALIGVGIVVLIYAMKWWALLALGVGLIGWIIGWLWR